MRIGGYEVDRYFINVIVGFNVIIGWHRKTTHWLNKSEKKPHKIQMSKYLAQILSYGLGTCINQIPSLIYITSRLPLARSQAVDVFFKL